LLPKLFQIPDFTKDVPPFNEDAKSYLLGLIVDFS